MPPACGVVCACQKLSASVSERSYCLGAILRRPPERPVEEIEVELVGLSAESGKQAAMFEGKGKLWRQVQEAVRQLGTQRDGPCVGKVVALDPSSRIPERRSALAELTRRAGFDL